MQKNSNILSEVQMPPATPPKSATAENPSETVGNKKFPGNSQPYFFAPIKLETEIK